VRATEKSIAQASAAIPERKILMSNETIWWIAFGVFVFVMLALDLFVFHRKAHVIKLREALIWSAAWVSLALLFGGGVFLTFGADRALQFFTGYLVEESLSVDNLFVFLMIFTYFNVPAAAKHKVLFWGILGALIMRGLFIATGLTIIERLHWVIYVFGAFLVFTGIRLAIGKDRQVNPEKNPLLRLACRFMPVTNDYRGASFFCRENGKRLATPLFLVVLVVETTDIVFAVDSIPAILSITLDPFIVYTSNIFAILGLRAIFFALEGATLHLRYLPYGLAAILTFLGLKMITSGFYKLPTGAALGVVGGILAISVVASVLNPKLKELSHPTAAETAERHFTPVCKVEDKNQ
jgi:tellurite resistance protein TerC